MNRDIVQYVEEVHMDVFMEDWSWESLAHAAMLERLKGYLREAGEEALREMERISDREGEWIFDYKDCEAYRHDALENLLWIKEDTEVTEYVEEFSLDGGSCPRSFGRWWAYHLEA